MTTKEKVLKALELNKGLSISGQELASQLKLSRTAIWKAIEELRKEGYAIDAITNKGYSLSSDNDLISFHGIQPYLKDQEMKNIFVYKSLESTNQTAKKLALEGAPHGTVVIAEEQTKGKGRLGRSFFSPANSGLYMSLILKPNFDASKPVLVTTAAAVAVCRAIEKLCQLPCQIKWVNDIYIGNKKICGILTEAVTHFETGQIEYLVLGIGINVNNTKADFPSEIRDVAGSLYESIKAALDSHEKSPPLISRNQLVGELINEITDIYQEMESKEFMAEYKSRSMVLGHEVRIIPSGTLDINQVLESAPLAKAIDIDENGGLIVEYQDGNRSILNSGEISVRLK